MTISINLQGSSNFAEVTDYDLWIYPQSSFTQRSTHTINATTQQFDYQFTGADFVKMGAHVRNGTRVLNPGKNASQHPSLINTQREVVVKLWNEAEIVDDSDYMLHHQMPMSAEIALRYSACKVGSPTLVDLRGQIECLLGLIFPSNSSGVPTLDVLTALSQGKGLK